MLIPWISILKINHRNNKLIKIIQYTSQILKRRLKNIRYMIQITFSNSFYVGIYTNYTYILIENNALNIVLISTKCAPTHFKLFYKFNSLLQKSAKFSISSALVHRSSHLMRVSSVLCRLLMADLLFWVHFL